MTGSAGSALRCTPNFGSFRCALFYALGPSFRKSAGRATALGGLGAKRPFPFVTPSGVKVVVS